MRFGAQVRPLIKIQKDLNLEGKYENYKRHGVFSCGGRRTPGLNCTVSAQTHSRSRASFGNQRKKLSVINVLNISTRTNKRFINTAFKLARKSTSINQSVAFQTVSCSFPINLRLARRDEIAFPIFFWRERLTNQPISCSFYQQAATAAGSDTFSEKEVFSIVSSSSSSLMWNGSTIVLPLREGVEGPPFNVGLVLMLLLFISVIEVDEGSFVFGRVLL